MTKLSEEQRYQAWKFFFKEKSSKKLISKNYNFHFDSLTRARKCKSKDLTNAFQEFAQISSMKAPKKKFVKNMGRCNRKKIPMLYLSSSTLSLPLEIGLEVGDLFCVAHFITKNTEEHGPYAVSGHQYLVKQAKLNYILQNYTTNFSEAQIKYDAILGRLMTAVNNKNGFGIYSLTNALCSIYFHRPKNSKEYGWVSNETYQVVQDETIGLIYPCVHFNLNSFNVVMNPKNADSIFHISELKLFEYQGYHDQRSLNLLHHGTGKVDRLHGNVYWSRVDKNQNKRIIFDE